MDNQANGYVQYQGMTNAIASGLSRLSDVCAELKLDAQTQELEKLQKRMNEHVFSVGIVGEFKRGKSTLINGLLGQEILPADPLPCSATLNYVRWDDRKRAEIVFKDGTRRQVPFEELSKYVTKLTAENAANADAVDYAAVYCPCQFCQNGVQIIDTPGLNDDERMTAITEKVLPSTDAIIMIIHALSPFSESEACFVREKIMASDLGRLFFIVNFIDLIDEDDRPRVLQGIRQKIQEAVLEKIEKVYGKNSAEYKSALSMVGDLKVLPVSGKKALKSKLKNDMNGLADSGYPDFESALTDLLTNQRGMLELVSPFKKIHSTAKEAAQTIDMRLGALRADAEEFAKVQEESKAAIAQTRQKKKTEITALKAKGKTLYVDLLPQVEEEYAQIEADVQSFIDGLEITEANVKDQNAAKAFSEKVTAEVGAKIREAASMATERLNVKICDQLGKDVEGLTQLGQEINDTIKDIQVRVSMPGDGSPKSIVMPALVDAGVTYGAALLTGGLIPGVGGIIAGYRNGGIKGAVLGGISGAAASVGAMALVGTLGVVGLPVALIGGVVAAFAGGGLSKLIFGKSRNTAADKTIKAVEKTRAGVRSSVEQSLRDMKSNAFLEKWLKESCENIYDSVASDIDREWEASLAGMEASLQQIAADLAKNETMRLEQEKDLTALGEKIKDILQDLKPISDRVAQAVSE